MSYELYFHPLAAKEWKKLAKDLQEQFKKQLSRRLENPHVSSARLMGNLSNCYKIKLRQSGYRLVYSVHDERLVVMVIAVGKRNNNKVYDEAYTRTT
jgi:mRNA interferase RelE/StbE